MAIRDPIDLHDRSQAFHKDFFNYHLKTDKPWFIKDAKSCYLAANRAFFDLHGLSHDLSIKGKSDKDLPFVKFCALNSTGLYEDDVLLNRQKIKTLEINFFNKNNYLTCCVLIRDSLPLSNGESLIYGEIESIPKNYSKLFILNELKLSGCDRGYDSDRVMDILNSVKNTNPLNELTKREWELAWLTLNGLTHIEIAILMGFSADYVKRRRRDIYTKLKVFYHDVFMLVGNILGWINFFPDHFISEPKSLIINHCMYKQPPQGDM